MSAAGRGMAPIVAALERQSSFLCPIAAARRGTPTGAPLAGVVPAGALSPGGEGRAVRLAAAALRDAAGQAAGKGLAPQPRRAGMALGTALGALEDLEDEEHECPPDAASYALYGARVAAAAAACGVGRSGFALDGPRSVFSVTCASGLCALEQAAADIALGRSDAMAVGGVDTLSDAMLAGFTTLGVLASGRARPFDARHDGIVIGEAACFVLLEPLAEAVARPGPPPAACVLSQRLESDAYHLTTPDPGAGAMARAIRRALDDAGLATRDLGGVLVTAAGSPLYDRMVSLALEKALGPGATGIPVSSWEPAVGHLLAATGIAAVGFAAEVLASGHLPAVYPVEELDPECRLDYVVDGPRQLDQPAVLCLIVGFGGQNGAVVVARPEVCR